MLADSPPAAPTATCPPFHPDPSSHTHRKPRWKSVWTPPARRARACARGGRHRRCSTACRRGGVGVRVGGWVGGGVGALLGTGGGSERHSQPQSRLTSTPAHPTDQPAPTLTPRSHAHPYAHPTLSLALASNPPLSSHLHTRPLTPRTPPTRPHTAQGRLLRHAHAPQVPGLRLRPGRGHPAGLRVRQGGGDVGGEGVERGRPGGQPVE